MHISLIDDEVILTQKIQKKLLTKGYWVTVFSGYQDFISRWNHYSDLYIIDISLGDGSGFDIIHWLRKNKKSIAPILILSGHVDSTNIIYWLEIGADDYVVKPFVPDVFLARVQALMRRSPILKKKQKVITYKEVRFDLVKNEVLLNGDLLDLTRQEKRMLELFLTNLDSVLTRDALIDQVWSGVSALDVKDNSINVTLSRLKKKLGNSFHPTTLYNQWYILKS